MSSNVNVYNLEKFKNTVLFSITLRRWGNRAQCNDMTALQAYIEQLKIEAAQEPDATDKPAPSVIVAGDRVKSTKVLVKSNELMKLCREQTDIKNYVVSRSMPSVFKAGMFVVREQSVPEIELFLRAATEKFKQTSLPEYIANQYPQDVEAARVMPVRRGGLGPLWRESDYPPADVLASLYDIDWYWLALGVPENIPDELKAEANEKFKRRMADAAEDIELALRAEFQALIAHAEERLATEPGEKPKVFRDSMIGNLIGFIETFDSKNVFGDERLEEVVNQAKQILTGADPKRLREFASVRQIAQQQFAKLKETMNTLVEEKKARRFDLDIE